MAKAVGLAWNWSRAFEEFFGVKKMYFARYENKDDYRFEISAFTDARPDQIKRFFKKAESVERVEIVDRDTGSDAHAFAYQMLKHLKPKTEQRDVPLVDVFHWITNMRGMNYVEELAFCSYRAADIAHAFVK